MDPTRYFSTLRKAALVAACGLPALASPAAPGPLPGQSYAQKLISKRPPVTVSGRVMQANGDALPGVTVLVKGTTLGVSTDANGSFTLSAPEGSTLVRTYALAYTSD